MAFYPIYGLLGRTEKSEARSFLGMEIDQLGSEVRAFVADEKSRAKACLIFPQSDALMLAAGLLHYARACRPNEADEVSTKLATAEQYVKEALKLMKVRKPEPATPRA
jgi:hypothetical protein